jgi:hypothetical protein
MLRHRALGVLVVLLGFVVGSVPLLAGGAANSDSDQVPITVTVTVLGSNYTPAPPVSKEDVTVHSGKTALQVTEWKDAHSGEQGNLQLAILIDEDAKTSLLGQQLSDLAKFIEAQPKTTDVGVFYARNGSAYAAATFSADHEEAAKSLRLTLGRSGSSPSIYMSLADLAAHWPSAQPGRREVLMICDGNDGLYPGFQDPYFEDALRIVQKSGVNVHTVYLGALGYAQSFPGDISQGKLVQVTGDTGGQSFFEVLATPISFAPYLDKLNQALNNQYLLTFLIHRSAEKKGQFREIQVRTEERNVKVSAPNAVFVPGL